MQKHRLLLVLCLALVSCTEADTEATSSAERRNRNAQEYLHLSDPEHEIWIYSNNSFRVATKELLTGRTLQEREGRKDGVFADVIRSLNKADGWQIHRMSPQVFASAQAENPRDTYLEFRFTEQSGVLDPHTSSGPFRDLFIWAEVEECIFAATHTMR
jgi:hypothetical protein